MCACLVFPSRCVSQAEQTVSYQEQLLDIAILEQAIAKSCPACKRCMDGDGSWENKFAYLRKGLDSTSTKTLFYKKLSSVFSNVCEAHATIAPDDYAPSNIEAQHGFLPILVRVLTDGIYVKNALSEDVKNIDGKKILVINGISVDKILQELQSLLPLESPARPNLTRVLDGQTFSSFYRLIYGESDRFDLVLVGADSETIRVSIKAKSYLEFKKAYRKKGLNIVEDDVELLALNDICIYTRFRSFNPEDGAYQYKGQAIGFKQVLSNLKNVLLKDRFSTLLLDLRGNEGGYWQHAEKLLELLLAHELELYAFKRLPGKNNLDNGVDKPIKDLGTPFLLKPFFEKQPDGTYLQRMESIKTIKPNKNNFNGNVILLVDEFTYSAALKLAVALRLANRATIYGRETSGRVDGGSSVFSFNFQLPHSGFYVSLPQVWEGWNVPPGDDPTRGLVPDVTVPLTIEDYLAGRDPVLKRALADIEQQ